MHMYVHHSKRPMDHAQLPTAHALVPASLYNSHVVSL